MQQHQLVPGIPLPVPPLTLLQLQHPVHSGKVALIKHKSPPPHLPYPRSHTSPPHTFPTPPSTPEDTILEAGQKSGGRWVYF